MRNIAFPKSSAKHLATRGFSQKSFVDVDFGHRSCPILKTFSSLVQIRIEKITKIIYVINMQFWEHNGHAKNGAKKSEFFGQNILTCDPEKCIYFVLSNKTEHIQSRQLLCDQTFSPHHNACGGCTQFMRAYLCFNW